MENTTPSAPLAPTAGSSKKKLWIILGIVLAVLILGGLLSGWLLKKVFTSIGTTAIEKAIEQSSGGKADVDLKDGKLSIKSDDGGSVTFGNQNLPENWPSEVKQYPGATIQYSGTQTGNDGKPSAGIVMLTKDSAETVIDFYKNSLPSEGWAAKDSVNYGSNDGSLSGLVFEKNNQRLTILVTGSSQSDGSAGTSITIAIEQK